MFTTSVPLGRFAGIPIGANWSVLVVLALIANLLAVDVLPATAPAQPHFWYWFTGVVTAVCFLASLLAHELAHAVLARHYGMKVKRITLWMLGGAAELDGEAPAPKAELVIAVVGPLTSLVLGGACWGASWWAEATPPSLAVLGLSWIGITNIALAVFNLLPGAPLDGGRILRALVWKWTGDRARATVVAARAGQGLGLLLVVGGVVQSFVQGALGGLWLAVIGWFLIFVAGRELAGGVARERLAGVRLRDLMDPHPPIAPGWWTVEAFLDHVAGTSRERVFPVTSFDGAPLGVVSLAELTRLSEQARLNRRVGDVARKPPRVVVADADEQLIDVMSRTVLRQGRDLVLVGEGGRLAGVIGPDDIARALDLAASGRTATGPPGNPFDHRLRG
jgi:Zn-dependent protease